MHAWPDSTRRRQVGFQGVGHAELALQNTVPYMRGRRAGRAPVARAAERGAAEAGLGGAMGKAPPLPPPPPTASQGM